MFDQPSWQQLKLKRVRYIVSWDYAKQPFEQAEVSAFMNAAHAAKQDVLVEFTARRGCFVERQVLGRRRRPARRPTSAYKAAVTRFHNSSRTPRSSRRGTRSTTSPSRRTRSPKLAARYYKAMKSVCKKCTVMAADVLD